MTAPLGGRRILVTRSAGQAGKLSDRLRALGAEPVEVPVLEIVPPESYEALDEALRTTERYDWLIFTSTNTLNAVRDRSRALGLHPEREGGMKIAAIGRATASYARQAGFRVDVVPDMQVSEGLVSVLGEDVRGKRVLLPRAARARDVIPEALQAGGATVDTVEAYRNVLPDSAPAQLKAALEQGIAAATFTSSSSVSHLAEAAEKAGLRFPLAGVAALSIGPVTSTTLREAGWEPAVEASPSDVDGLIAATVRWFARQAR